MNFPQFLGQIDQAIKTLDHAAAMDMKWWFLGLLTIFMGSIWILAKSFTKRHDALSAKFDATQAERISELKDVNNKQSQAMSVFATALDRFTNFLDNHAHLFEKS